MSNESPWQSLIDQSLGYSDWLIIDQQRINHFADVTEDHQFIHVDPDAAAKTTFGSTIAHGFLSFSLVSTLMYQLIAPYRGNSTIVNYGSNKLRFITPVKSGSRIRLQMVLTKITKKSATNTLLTFNSTMEIEGENTPAFIAENLMMVINESLSNQ